jgi:hypothetical protein
MTLTMLLLSVILFLLLVIVCILVTGWPGRERVQIERAAGALRREIAEHRADSIQLLLSIRMEVEDAVRESIVREMAGYAAMGAGRSRSSRNAAKVPKAATGEVEVQAVREAPPAKLDESAASEEGRQSDLEARQISLFPGFLPEGEAMAMAWEPAQGTAASRSGVVVGDDLPDVE